MTGHGDGDDTVRLAKALAAIRSLRTRISELERGRAQPIAIVGVGCRFPAAPDPASFWRLLREGRDAIGDIPPDRWDVPAYHHTDPHVPGRMYCRSGGFLDDVRGFDAAFFGISPVEAKRLDPQQRLLLEVSWEALEDAGRDPRALHDSRTGVFVGISEAEYLHLMHAASGHVTSRHDVTGTALSLASGRLSYQLGLHGPNLALDTACSSALVAVHLAVASLRSGESDLALAGGVSLMLAPEAFVAFCESRALAADGRCKTFDAAADGYGRGEGAGVVVLKRLSEAVTDGDTVYAVIAGSAVNSDGRTNGLTAPSGLAQRDVIRRALADAGIEPARIGYVEAHGTGTPLGDPIEIGALGAVLGDRWDAGRLLVGSVKTNIGHTEAAAGIAGLIKAALALRHGQIPPSLHFCEPNPHIPWAQLPVEVPVTLTAWPPNAPAAGVSSFGFSGTNAHVVLEPAEPEPAGRGPERPERPCHLLALSARTAPALRELAGRHAAALAGQPAARLADVAYTVGSGRSRFPHRLAVAASSADEAAGLLSAFAEERRARLPAGHAEAAPRLAFLFPGQGSQHEGMGRLLCETHPGFRRDLEHCAEILSGHGFLSAPLLDVLYPQPGGAGDGLIDRTSHAQPAIVALEYALARLWRSWGVEPHVVVGHSTGEYTAACVAGVFGIEDCLRLVALRAQMIEEATGGGATAAVFAAPQDVAPLLHGFAGRVSTAGVNGPRETLIAGEAAAVTEALAEVKNKGLDGRLLKVPHAPHSPLIEPVLPQFAAVAARVSFAEPQIPMISNVTGSRIGHLDAAYWCRQMREPVRFADCVTALAGEGCQVLLEVGPQPVLQLLGRQSWAGPPVRWLSSLWEGRDDWKQMLHSLGELFVAGAEIDWATFDREYSRRRVPAPTYPFQRTQYWFSQEEDAMVADQARGAARRDRIATGLRDCLSAGLETPPDDVGPQTSFIDLGADSLLLMRLLQDISERYGVTLTIGRFFDDLDTLDAVAGHLDAVLPPGALPAAAGTQAEAGQPVPTAAVPTAAVPGELARGAATAAAAPVSPEAALASAAAPAGNQSAIARLVAAQLEVMSRQLEVLAQAGGTGPETTGPETTGPETTGPETTGPDTTGLDTTGLDTTGPQATASDGPQRAHRAQPAPAQHLADAAGRPETLTGRQRKHLDELLARYQERTAVSRQRAAVSRNHRADTRMRSVRPETRPVSYPVIAERAEGSRFWDVDGNEYIDIAMGIGVLLCGHNPGFVTSAITEQLTRGLQGGPVCALGDEAAALVCELTGMERAFFTVTGTDAVRGALRIAQAATGRSRFVMFSGSYHGQDDRVLAVPDVLGDPERSLPMAPGISPQAAGDALILSYGTASALATIEAHAPELAAVLVEPVQSRNPALQPAGFLRDLRALTGRLGIPLIFDEVITGFRVHPGGAQAHFGVRADIAAYGKAIGGGMAVGVVAGRAEYLDRVDGGARADGSGADPGSTKTYIGSTFEMHPLTMASTVAMLRHLRDRGPALQQELTARTSYLAGTLNAFLAAEQVPIQVMHFGSMFRFAWKGNTSYAHQPLAIEVFHIHLLARGIYLWEGRTCFLSTAHTDADLEGIITAVQETVAMMREGGFLPDAGRAMPRTVSTGDTTAGHAVAAGNGGSGGSGGNDGNGATARAAPDLEGAPVPVALGEEAQALLAFERNRDPGGPSWVVAENIGVRGTPDRGALADALEALVLRHEALRTVFPGDGAVVLPRLPVTLDVVDLTDAADQDKVFAEKWRSILAEPFDLDDGPLLRVALVRLGAERHYLALAAHHIVMDGWSVPLLVDELAALYTAARRGGGAALPPPVQYRDFLTRQARHRAGRAAHRRYWQEMFRDGCPDTLLPADRPRPEHPSNAGDRITFTVAPGLYQAVTRVARAHRATSFMALLAAYGLLIHRVAGADDVVIGVPQAGRTVPGSESVVGYCAHFLPLRSRLAPGGSIADYLAQVRDLVLAAVDHPEVAFPWWRETVAGHRDPASFPLPLRAAFNLDVAVPCPEFDGLAGEFQPVPVSFALTDLRMDAIQSGGGLRLDCDYRTDLFEPATVRAWCDYYLTLLEELARRPDEPIARLPAPPQPTTAGKSS